MHVAPDGTRTPYALGRVLPGQRDGSSKWSDSIETYLREELSTETCIPNPTLLRIKRDGVLKSLLQSHVDDFMALARRSFFHDKLVPTLKRKYRITVQTAEVPGDSVSFLKRKHLLLDSCSMVVVPHPKHIERVLQLVGWTETSKVKRTPAASDTNRLTSPVNLSQHEHRGSDLQ